MNALTSEQKDLAARLFNHLVAPSGTKIAHESRTPTSDRCRSVSCSLFSRRSPNGASFALSRRVAASVTRSLRRARPAVLGWRRSSARSSVSWRNRIVEDGFGCLFGLVLVALALMAGVTPSRCPNAVRHEQARGRARLEALARGAFETDPERGLAFALEAALLSPTPSSEETLRDARQASRVLRVVQFDEPLSSLPGARRGDRCDGRWVSRHGRPAMTVLVGIETGREAHEPHFRGRECSPRRRGRPSAPGSSQRVSGRRPRRERQPRRRALGRRKARRQLRRDGHASDRGGLRQVRPVFRPSRHPLRDRLTGRSSRRDGACSQGRAHVGRANESAPAKAVRPRRRSRRRRAQPTRRSRRECEPRRDGSGLAGG